MSVTRGRRTTQFFLLALAGSASLVAATPAVRAEDAAAAPAPVPASAPQAGNQAAGRVSVLEENDSLYFNSDKHYTQGIRFSDLFPTLAPGSGWNAPFDWFGGWAPVFQPNGAAPTERAYAVLLGQSLFTPKNLSQKPPDRHDRPYGGWLYGGASLLQDSGGRMLENFELDLGVVGPGAFGEEVQNDFHQLIGAQQAKGWSDQIQNEPGINLTYQRIWRVPLIGETDGVDFVPQIGATVGNVFTFGEVGGMLRIGRSLGVDYGPVRIQPGLSGTDYFNPSRMDGNHGYYFFVGVQGRVVGRNIFLDGNSFRQSPSIAKKTLVGDAEVGFSYFWSTKLRLDFSVVERSEEFVGQRTPDEVGTAALAFSW